MNRELVQAANGISALNHDLERTMLEARRIQGELIAAEADFCIQAGLSPMAAKKSLERRDATLASIQDGLTKASIAHSSIHESYKTLMGPPMDCPEVDHQDTATVATLAVVG